MAEIKNPIKQRIVLTYIGAAFGIVLIFAPILISSFKFYQFYFVYVGVVTIIFSIGFFIFYLKRSMQFEEFMAKKEESLVRTYDED